MSKNFTLEDSMEKKVYAPKGCLMQIDGSSRLRQDASGSGAGNQVLGLPFSKSKPQRRHRRDGHGSQAVANCRSESSSQKYQASKGNRKGKTVDVPDQIDDKGFDDLNQPAELGSLQAPGSKKQNLNHLLNFHFTPREPQGRPSSSHFHHQPFRPVVRSKLLHDSFIQANCQFVVASDDDVEYHVDLPMNWKSVEQIIIRTYGGTPSCPICLCSPSAAKITKCGHVFCWSCILRYFSYGDGRHSQPCPICFHLINPSELKSVLANLMDEVHAGDMVKMQLMCRKKDCPDSYSVPLNSKMHGSFLEEKRFQKLLRLTPPQIQSEVLDREHLELSSQLDATIESLETEFVLAALTELEIRKKKMLEKVSGSLCTEGNQDATRQARAKIGISRDASHALNIDESQVATGSQVPVLPVINWDEYACFFQAEDGGNNFMAPLNMAMFWKHFGPNPIIWPQTITLRVMEIELLTVTAELRKRFKFLQHVPLSSSIQLLEVDLKGTVGKEVLGEFSYQLNERKRRRSERARAERRRERLQQEAERMAHMGPEKPKIESLSDFPECRSPEAEAHALAHAIQESLAIARGGYENSKDSTTTRSDSSAGSSFSTDLLVFPEAQPYSYPSLDLQLRPNPSLSFAQALNTPQFKTRLAANTSTTPIISTVSNIGGKRIDSEKQRDPDESEIPAFRTSISDAIASAFATFTLNDKSVAGATGGNSEESASAGIGKKKGRKKGKVLFATAMGMGNN